MKMKDFARYFKEQVHIPHGPIFLRPRTRTAGKYVFDHFLGPSFRCRLTKVRVDRRMYALPKF
jgi:hypothetical protein